MRAVTIDAFDAAPAVRDDLPDPTVADDGLVVRVHASSVNPVDNAIATGMVREMFDHDFPVVLGRDYAGTVEAVGADAKGTRSATRFSASSCTQIPPSVKEAGPS